jgi:hypothetical protein
VFSPTNPKDSISAIENDRKRECTNLPPIPRAE